MSERMKLVEGKKEIALLAKTAQGIWRDFFVGIITKEQIEYMLDKFQSEKAITKQIQEGYEYYFLMLDEQVIGYTGIHKEEKKLFLSKLYLKKEYRGQGFASKMFRFIIDEGRKAGLSSVYLTVNKHNDHAVEVYKKKGFEIVDTQVADIGGGFVMDDFIMEKQI